MFHPLLREWMFFYKALTNVVGFSRGKEISRKISIVTAAVRIKRYAMDAAAKKNKKNNL